MSLFDGAYSQLSCFDVTKCIERNNIAEKNDDGDSVAGKSWVDIAPSRGSLSSIGAITAPDSDLMNKDFSRDSPVSAHSSNVEIIANMEQVKYRLAKDFSSARSIDWIWDWSSQVESIPDSHTHRSVLSTPPNSPDENSPLTRYNYKRKSSVNNLEMFFGLVVSNFFTFVIGAAIGLLLLLFNTYNKLDRCDVPLGIWM
uniref:Autophagy-related protein n=1 Tax=Syphacia muris TaxID=451379 RepID=A0A0N5AWW1_9BILA